MSQSIPRVVDVLWHPLEPSGSGNRQRILNLARYAHGIDLQFIGPGPSPESGFGLNYVVVPPAQALPRRMGFNPMILGYMPPAPSRRLVDAVLAHAPDLIMAEGLWAARAAAVAARKSGLPLIITVNNIESVVMRRRGKRFMASVLASIERRWYRSADHIIVASVEDAEHLRRLLNSPDPAISIVPNGVDEPEFPIEPVLLPHPNALFLGKTDYPPNAEAIRLFQSSWLPAAHSRGTIVNGIVVGGPEAPREEKDLLFTGYVETIWPYLASADLCVAPIKAGSGTRLKILSYLVSGKPVIATGIAVEGLGMEPDVHYVRVESSEQFAAAASRLLDDPAECERLSRNGRALARGFLWPPIAEKWSQVLVEIAGRDA